MPGGVGGRGELVIGGGARWLSAFGVVIAVGLSAAAIAIAVTLAGLCVLFWVITLVKGAAVFQRPM